MRKEHVAIVAMLVLVCMCLPCAADSAEVASEIDTENLIYNASFEQMRDGRVDGWFGNGAEACGDEAYSGVQSLKVSQGGRLGALGIATTQTLKYRVGGWLKSDGNSDCGLLVDFYTYGGQWVQGERIQAQVAAGEWEYVEATITVPRGMGGMSVSAYNAGEAAAYVDDVVAYELYQARLTKTDMPPVIDGVLDDSCWEDASVGDEDWMTTKGTVAKQQTRVFACYDDDTLYIAFRLYTKKPKGLKADETRDDFYVWRDESAEVFIDPHHSHNSYCELEVNPNNVEYDAWQYDKNWECLWEHEVGFEKDAWICEMAIDLASFEIRSGSGEPTGRMPLPSPDVWGINFARNDSVTKESSSWPAVGASFHNAPAYGHLLRFDPVRGLAYAAEAQWRLEQLQRQTTVYQTVVDKAGYQAPAAEDEQSADVHSLSATMVQEFTADLATGAEQIAAAESYEHWLATSEWFSRMEMISGLLEMVVHPTKTRQYWTEKTGCPVNVALSLTPRPVTNETLWAEMFTDRPLTVYMGRDEVNGFGAVLDAFADVENVRVEVDIDGVWQGGAAVLANGSVEHLASYRWPLPETELQAMDRMAIWVPLRTTEGTTAGPHKGIVRVLADNHPTLEQELTVYVRDYTVPRENGLALSVLQPDFSAADITGELAGFGVTNGSVSVGTIPRPANDESYSDEELSHIVQETKAVWEAFGKQRPELGRYVLGVMTPNTKFYPELARVYSAVHKAVRGVKIMHVINDPQTPAADELDKWVDIWAVSTQAWETTALGTQGNDQRWLYYAIPGHLGAEGLGDARVQPWIARHLGADGIVWDGAGMNCQPNTYPMYEMYCRAIAMGHRDCDYFTYLNKLWREDFGRKAGDHWRLKANLRTASEIYPSTIIGPDWYNDDYSTLAARIRVAGELIERAERHLKPIKAAAEDCR